MKLLNGLDSVLCAFWLRRVCSSPKTGRAATLFICVSQSKTDFGNLLSGTNRTTRPDINFCCHLALARHAWYLELTAMKFLVT
jgi:hypothetical protein